jgi:hypothetical protein
MRLKKLAMALLAVFVLGAVMANSAFAENEFKEPATGTWFVNGTKLAVGTHKALTTTAVGTSDLLTSVGRSPLKLTTEKITCLECFIDNTEGTVATIMGTLSFTEVKFAEPAGCSVSGGEIKTKPLTAVVGMIKAGTAVTLQFKPETGTTFVTVVLTGTSCAIAGEYKFTGVQYAEAKNATGVFKASQEITTSEAIQKSAGTATSLKFGANPAILSGHLTGALTSGETFGTEE